MEQRSTEWHAARRGMITGSIVGAILGYSPYMTREDVLRTLVRSVNGAEPEFTGNIATEWGIQNELGAIEEYTMITGRPVAKATFVKLNEIYGASPDGYVGNDGLIEVKCPYGIRNDPFPVTFKTASDQKNYFAQMQFQMHVTGANWCDFWQWTINDHRLERVERDNDFITWMMSEIQQFYEEEYYPARENPDEDLADAIPTINNQRAMQMVIEYRELQEAEDIAKDRKKELLEEIVKLSGGRTCFFGGAKLTKVEKEGAVSYAKVVKEKLPGLDLTQWRGKPSSYWMLK